MRAPCCDSSDFVVSKQVKQREGCNFEQIVWSYSHVAHVMAEWLPACLNGKFIPFHISSWDNAITSTGSASSLSSHVSNSCKELIDQMKQFWEHVLYLAFVIHYWFIGRLNNIRSELRCYLDESVKIATCLGQILISIRRHLYDKTRRCGKHSPAFLS
jgi:hypothetical protein